MSYGIAILIVSIRASRCGCEIPSTFILAAPSSEEHSPRLYARRLCSQQPIRGEKSKAKYQSGRGYKSASASVSARITIQQLNILAYIHAKKRIQSSTYIYYWYGRAVVEKSREMGGETDDGEGSDRPTSARSSRRRSERGTGKQKVARQNVRLSLTAWVVFGENASKVWKDRSVGRSVSGGCVRVGWVASSCSVHSASCSLSFSARKHAAYRARRTTAKARFTDWHSPKNSIQGSKKKPPTGTRGRISRQPNKQQIGRRQRG